MKKVLFWIALVFIGILSPIIISEAFLRLFPNITGIYTTVYSASPPIYLNNEERGYSLLPGAVGKHWSIDGDYHVIYGINSQGLRSSVKFYGNKTRKRILLLGDSFVFGQGVKDNEILSVKLEAILNERAGAKNAFEVISAGVPSYATDNEYMALKAFLPLKPDMVLLGICENDIPDLLDHEWALDKKGDIIKVIHLGSHVNRDNRMAYGPMERHSKIKYFDELKEFSRSHSFLYTFLLSLRYRTRGFLDVHEDNDIIKDGKIERKDSLERFFKALLLIEDLCKKEKIEFVVFSVDGALSKYPELKDRVPGILDIRELYSAGKNINYTYPNDRHWSPEGTVYVAEWLAGHLEKYGFIEK